MYWLLIAVFIEQLIRKMISSALHWSGDREDTWPVKTLCHLCLKFFFPNKWKKKN